MVAVWKWWMICIMFKVFHHTQLVSSSHPCLIPSFFLWIYCTMFLYEQKRYLLIDCILWWEFLAWYWGIVVNAHVHVYSQISVCPTSICHIPDRRPWISVLLLFLFCFCFVFCFFLVGLSITSRQFGAFWLVRFFWLLNLGHSCGWWRCWKHDYELQWWQTTDYTQPNKFHVSCSLSPDYSR